MLDAETFLSADKALEYGLIDEIINPVNLADSMEIAQQAMNSKNPVAKKAIEHIRQAQQPQEPKPQPKKKEQDCFEWFAAEFKM